MWTRKEFEAAAQKIGEDFVASGGETSINDLSMKVAQAGGLNPEGIRTVVRLANVTAFEQAFEKRSQSDSEDRMIEFTVGDPEVVISQLHSCTKEAQVQEEEASSYSRTDDYFGDFEYAKLPLEKTAAYVAPVPEEKLPTRQEVNLLFKRAEDKMKEDQHRAQHLWENSISKAASVLVALDSRTSARAAFEKNALSLLGPDIVPELNLLHTYTSPKGSDVVLFGGEKIGNVIGTHITSVLKAQQPIIELLKTANNARKESHVKTSGLKWLAKNRARVSK